MTCKKCGTELYEYFTDRGISTWCPKCGSNPLTVFIPTKDRPLFLSKLLNFYAERNLPYEILIGDSSESPEPVLYDSSLKVCYESHPTGMMVPPSVGILLEKIKTPYSVFCSDDDYLVPDQLHRCVKFLESNPDYSAVTGDQVEVFTDLNGSKMKILKILQGSHKAAEHPLPSQRLLQWITPNIGKNTFAVQPTEVLRWTWGETAKLGIDDKMYAPLQELSHNVLNVIHGKQKHLPGLYHVMLRHTQKTGHSGPVDYFERVSSWDWSSKVIPTMECWSKELLRRESLDPETARQIAEKAFLQWFIPFLSRNNARKLKESNVIEMRKSFPLFSTIRNLFRRSQRKQVLDILKQAGWIVS